MRLLKPGAILVLFVLPACGGKSAGSAPGGPAPVAVTVTHPNVVGVYAFEMSGARNMQATKQTLEIVARDKPGSFTATLSSERGTVQYPTGRWQGEDLILNGSDARGNPQQLKLRFDGARFTGTVSFSSSTGRVSSRVEGRKQ